MGEEIKSNLVIRFLVAVSVLATPSRADVMEHKSPANPLSSLPGPGNGISTELVLLLSHWKGGKLLMEP